MNLNRRSMIIQQSNGETLFLNPYTGQYYPRILDFTPASDSENKGYMTGRWDSCDKLQEATIRGYTRLGRKGDGAKAFSNCKNLRKLVITHGCQSGDTYLANNCPKLQEIQIGSVGHVGHTLYSNSFSSSGTQATDKTLTVYVTDTETIPVSGAPWGFTGANVIYRSSTTGEIREV